jgi:hypothetical protein
MQFDSTAFWLALLACCHLALGVEAAHPRCWGRPAEASARGRSYLPSSSRAPRPSCRCATTWSRGHPCSCGVEVVVEALLRARAPCPSCRLSRTPSPCSRCRVPVPSPTYLLVGDLTHVHAEVPARTALNSLTEVRAVRRAAFGQVMPNQLPPGDARAAHLGSRSPAQGPGH